MSDILQQIRKTGRIKECFFYNKETCKGKIKAAHSIQRSKKLELLTNEINGNKVLYSLVDTKRDKNGKSIDMKGIGVANASTFFGFCDFHDSKLFAPIENNTFNESSLHCFLHSFRSFAYSYHTILETINLFRTANTPLALIEINRLYETLNQVDMLKIRFQDMFNEGNFDFLNYYYLIKPTIYPVACSGGFQVEYSIKNRSFRNSTLPVINLTIFPEATNQTVIILSWMPEDENANIFMDEFVSLNELRQDKIITSIMIAYAENSFVSPSLWSKLNTKEKKQLLFEIDTSDPVWRNQINRFWTSELNFFSQEYAIENYR